MKKTMLSKLKIYLSREEGSVRSALHSMLSVFLLMIISSSVFAQSKTVTGKVTNKDGLPVAASVNVKGTTTGAIAGEDGNFSIQATDAAVLVVSAAEYVVQEIIVGKRSVVNVVLIQLDKSLNEVVVVGYGTLRKEAVTGSVATISGNNLREIPAPNFTQALQGRLAGVDVTQTSTQPGAVAQIRIRGTRSLTADNNPLIVLDGIPFIGALGDINPDDIKTMDILKDASSTAIYGSRGANGVILITTEKGSKNRKPRISFSTYVGAQEVFAKYPMMNGPQFSALRKAAGQYTNGQDEDSTVNTDWQDLFYKTGIVTDNNISVSGGTETGSYNFGMGYYLNQGVIPTQQYKRYSVTGAVDQQIGKYFKAGFSTKEIFGQSDGNQVGLYNTLSMSPIASPYNPDGSLKRSIRMPLDNQYIYTKGVVDSLQDTDQWVNQTNGFASYNAIYGEVKAPWVEGLKFRINLGLDYTQANNGAYTGQGVGDGANPNTVSTGSKDARNNFHWTVENLLSYDHTFSQKHTINAVALYSAEQNKYTRTNIAATDIPANAFLYYNLGRGATVTVDPNNQDYQLWGLESFMGRVMYSYNNRYIVSATVRSDGSSRLAPGNKWHTYPAISAGWNISNESFMKNVSFVNNLKLRVGYGQTSNQAIAPYSTLGLLSTRPYNFGPTGYATGYYVTGLPNPDLGWEYSKSWNFGVDFTILKNRLSGTMEYYITNTENVLMNLSLPPTSGVGNILSNIGTTQNKGFELSLNGTIIENKNGWTWNAGFNFYTNNNTLTSLASGQTRDEANWWFVGHNINAIYDFKKIGLWQQGDEYLTTYEPGGNPGMIKVEYTGAYNPDGSPVRAIGAADRQIMDVDPKWQGGFNTSVAYKGFDLGLVGFFRHGGVLFSTIHGSNGYLNLLSGRRNNIDVDYWTPTNTGAKYPKPGGIVSSDNPKYGSTLSYFDGGFLKIRTITLGYDLNRSVIKNPAIKMRVYFTAQNPFVMFSEFNKESGLDPESNSYGNENAAANLSQNLRRILTVGFNTPATRNYIIGANLTF